MEFDAESNLSQISNQSDDIKSTISSISGLSNYQDEFTDLRHLVNPEKYPTSQLQRDRDQASTPVNDSGCDLQYEDRIADLSYQLQSTLKKNEQYKNELYNLEMKFEIKYHDKIEKLLRFNNKLETELANANEQIHRLITNYSTKDEPQLHKENNFIVLEKKYHNLSLENSNLERKYNETSKAKQELEYINQKLRIDFNDSRVELETKNVCIKQLKEKISEQFVENQLLTKSNNLINQILIEKNTETEQVKNMLEWYKKQLDVIQHEKKIFVEDISNYRLEIASKTEKIDSLTLELKSLENKFRLYQLEVLKEKEKLYEEIKQSNIPTDNKIEFKEKKEIKSDKPILTYYENTIEDLKTEINSVKKYIKEQEEFIKTVSKENSDLVSRCVATQKMLVNKNLEIEEAELRINQLKSETKILNDNQTKKNYEIELLKEDKTKLETLILSSKEEKYFVDMSVKTIREQFTSFLTQYNKLKQELLEKNKQILNLQNEKQELFMNNNWKVCELEKSKNKEIQIDNLKKDIVAKENIISEHLVKIKSMEIDLKTKEEKFVILDHNYKKEIDRYDNVLLEYKKMFEQYQIRIKDLEDTITATKFLTKDLKDNLNILKNELKQRDLEISDLRNNNQHLLKQFEYINKKRDITKQDKGTVTNHISLKDVETITDYHNFQIESSKVSEIIQNIDKEDLFQSKTNGCQQCGLRENDQNILKQIKYITNETNVCKQTVPDNFSSNLAEKDCKIFTEICSFQSKSCFSNIDRSIQTEDNFTHLNVNQSKAVDIKSKFNRLMRRIKNLEKNVLECKKKFNTLEIEKLILDKDKIELNALLQVKSLELKEQQKKYERNYRTLLRKVREHMKGRNSAEKQNKYLQDLYNKLSEENNSLKLSLSSKVYENDENKKLLTDFVNINEKLKKELRELEKKLKLSKICTRCVEFDAMKDRLTHLEEFLDDMKKEKQCLEGLVIEKESIVLDLQQKTQEIHSQITILATDNKHYQCQIEEIQINQNNSLAEKENFLKQLQNKQLSIEDLSSRLENEKQLNEIKNQDIFTLKNRLRVLEDNLEYVTKEKENLSISLQALKEELQFFKMENDKKDSFKTKQFEEQDKIVDEIKNRLQDAHRELSAVSSEKFFVQRLCNDLKVALKSYANQNQILKEKVDLLLENRQDSLNSRSSLPDLPSLQSFDENFVNNLLQESRFVPSSRPLSDIQLSLDTLRKEIFILQEQISKKNLRTV